MSDQAYPLPRFYFSVDWGGTMISFTEVTGLVTDRETILYRHSNSPELHRICQPGLKKAATLVLKRGKFEKDFELDKWFKDATVEKDRRDITISLLNEKKDVVASWRAVRCFPTKITGPDLKSDANEIAIESIEVAHEGLSHFDPPSNG
jgi:phage tail-like protein